MEENVYKKLVVKESIREPFKNDFYRAMDKLSYNTAKDNLKGQKKIILSAGHSTKQGEDRGAVGCGFIEAVENAKIRKRVYEILKTKYNTEAYIDGDETILKKSMDYFTSLINKNKWKQSEAIALEIHFNAAATPTAKGTETVIPENYTQFELKLASELSRGISGIIKNNLRGGIEGHLGVITEASSRAKRLGWMRIPAENVLIETCFITNQTEMNAYVENFENICQTIAAILYHNSLNY